MALSTKFGGSYPGRFFTVRVCIVRIIFIRYQSWPAHQTQTVCHLMWQIRLKLKRFYAFMCIDSLIFLFLNIQLFCVTRGKHFHGSCVGLGSGPGVRTAWQCNKCKVCITCRTPVAQQGTGAEAVTDRTKMLVGDTCDKNYPELSSLLRPVTFESFKFLIQYFYKVLKTIAIFDFKWQAVDFQHS